MKEDATYYLGVVTLGEGEFAAAIDFLDRMTLEASPDGRWADAARINAAMAYAASDQPEKARTLLEADESPQRFGSRLIARQLPGAPAEAPLVP
jgi:tetratricopeptide (TPR) repeat protein